MTPGLPVMSEVESIPGAEVQFQACLTHLYDYAFLFNHPLLAQLIPHESGAERVPLFRERVIQTIEQMRPASNLPFHSKAARAYNVLTLRYIDQQETEAIMQQLALSRRQYFREHAHALSILYQMVFESAGIAPAETGTNNQRNITLETEIASLHHYVEQEQVDLTDLLMGVLEATHRLAEQHQMRVIPPDGGAPLILAMDRTLLRQILLSFLSTLITQAEPGTVAHCSYEASDGSLVIRFVCDSNPVSISAVQAAMDGALRGMLQTLGAEISAEDGPLGKTEFRITLPYKLLTVLIIDDNRDVIELFRRYFVNQPYRVVAAHDGAQAVEMIRQQVPDVIILDIMLPRQDGYEILQKLKNHPSTAHIPILVCSILETSSLALSLGADGYLKKPPERAALLAILDQMLA